MSKLALPQDSTLIGEREYIAALDVVIAEAEQTLQIFDQDCETGDFASLKRFALIEAFLNKSTETKLTIILHDARFFTSYCPRLLNLLKTFSHKMTIYETNSRAKIAKDCFILADGHAYIRRFHINQARFKYVLDDAEATASLANRFDELLQETSHKITAAQLGL